MAIGAAGTVDTLNVRITGDSGPFRREVGRAKRAASGFGRLARGAMRTAAAGATAAAAAGGLAAKEYIGFEQALAEVEKAADAETAQALESDIKSLAEEIPLAQEQLAGLAADAARFGVEGRENITEFTRVAGEMAAAFPNLEADRAAESIAKIGTLTETPIENSRELGSAINSLGNEARTSSGEIIEAMLKSSGALNQLGADTGEIAALNATINEVSESARRGGTRLRRFAQELQDPQRVEAFAEALEMTPEAFKAMRSEDPVELIRQIAETMGEGGEQADILRRNMGSASRTAVTGLSKNLDGLADNLETSNEQMATGESLARELGIETSTTSGQLRLLQNRARNAAITLGGPVVENVTAVTEGFTDAFGPDTQSLVQQTAGFLEDNVTASEDLGQGLGEAAVEASEFVSSIAGGEDSSPSAIVNNLVDELDGINWTRRGEQAGEMGATIANTVKTEIDQLDFEQAGAVASNFASAVGGATETFFEEVEWQSFGKSIGRGTLNFLEGADWTQVGESIWGAVKAAAAAPFKLGFGLGQSAVEPLRESEAAREGSDFRERVREQAREEFGPNTTIRNVRFEDDGTPIVTVDDTDRSIAPTTPPSPAPGDFDPLAGTPLAAGRHGGIVTRPTMSLIGEAGPEAVVPLNRTRGNRPLPDSVGGTTVRGPLLFVENLTVENGQDADQIGRRLGKQIRRELDA